MSHFVISTDFETDFRVPPDCLRDGDVSCQVLAAHCDVVDRWDDLLTFRVRVLLRVTIRSGELRCAFEREVFFRETIWADPWSRIGDCEVEAAACQCCLVRGRLSCVLRLVIQFTRRRPDPIKPCPCPCRCTCSCECDPVSHDRAACHESDDDCGRPLRHCRHRPQHRFSTRARCTRMIQ